MPLSQIHILLIEDHPGDVRLLMEQLRDSGLEEYVLHRKENLAEGRKVPHETKIDVILLDLGLPDSMGLDTFDAIYAEFPTYPIIVLTGHADSSLGLKAVKRGAQDFLEKMEVKGPLLGKTIKYAIERNQMLRRLEEAQQLAKVGNWEVDLGSNQFLCSNQIYNIFERGPGGKFQTFEDYMQAIYPEDQQIVAENIQKAFSTGKRFKVDHRIQMDDGRIKHVVLQGKAEKDDVGALARLIGTTQDITDRKQVEELTRQKELAIKSAKLRKEFLAKTSHEIRTPLNPILLLTTLLLESDLTPQQKEYLNAIRAAGDTLLAVVNDILDLSKIEAGKIDFIRNSFNISQVFEHIEDMMKPNAVVQNLDFVMEVDNRLPEFVIGDDVRLTQILLNLVGNAIKFTHKGRVHIAARKKLQRDDKLIVEFSVEDTGIGIAEDKLKVIFDSFQQIESDVNRRHGGTGLGLTIVKQLVKLQGGHISVKSEVGKGSVFSFELTFDLSKKELDGKEETIIDKTRLAGMEILLVEDNPLNQLVTKKLLTDWGIQLDIANNGKEGVECLGRKGYDLVLMDVQMPEMDGYEATRFIREQMEAPKKDTPIIALTANAFSGSDDECLKVGMNDYVSKPIEIQNLYSKILQHAHVARPVVAAVPANGNGHMQIIVEEESQLPEEAEEKNDMNFTDLSYLEEISGGDRTIIRKTIDKFIETTPGILSNMDQLLADGDYPGLGRSAHKLKSSVAFMGINEIKDTILQVEHSAKNKENLDRLPALVSRIRTVIEHSYTELRNADV